MKLFVGLGNPGGKYSGNRHNVGFMAVDRIATDYGFSPWRKRFQGVTADGMIDDQKVLLLKPVTFMNESGKAVGAAVRFLKINLADVTVFYDEIDLAAGKLKVKTGGGNAGHNGLRSITHLVGNNYERVRIGVGHPGVKELVAGYVLHDFSREDRVWLEPMLDAMSDACPHLATGDAARFLSDVAKTLNPPPPKPPRPQNTQPGKGRKDGKSDKNSKGSKGSKGNNNADSAPVKDGQDKTDAPKDTVKDTTKDIAAPANTKPAATDARRSGPRHPAGERQSKQQNALAANLQKWLQGRDKK